MIRTYDKYGRLTGVARPESNTTYAYNTDSLLTSEISSNGTRIDYEESLVMFSVPFFMKYHFGKYFYVSPGIRFNYHPDLGYSWGLGAFAGMGAEYTFTSGISLSITPQAHIDMLSIGGVDESYNNFGNYDDKIAGIGVNVKIGYWF